MRKFLTGVLLISFILQPVKAEAFTLEPSQNLTKIEQEVKYLSKECYDLKKNYRKYLPKPVNPETIKKIKREIQDVLKDYSKLVESYHKLINDRNCINNLESCSAYKAFKQNFLFLIKKIKKIANTLNEIKIITSNDTLIKKIEKLSSRFISIYQLLWRTRNFEKIHELDHILWTIKQNLRFCKHLMNIYWNKRFGGYNLYIASIKLLLIKSKIMKMIASLVDFYFNK